MVLLLKYLSKLRETFRVVTTGMENSVCEISWKLIENWRSNRRNSSTTVNVNPGIIAAYRYLLLFSVAYCLIVQQLAHLCHVTHDTSDLMTYVY